jgi:phosphoglycolate phosphatase-like HAD superfamily hydrolase
MERLILFDIDGTLTRTRNGYIPFNEAILNTFGIDGDIRTVIPDGNTDPMIVKDIFAKAGVEISIEDTAWGQFGANLKASFRSHVQQGTTMIQPLPGAMELLQALAASDDFSSGVVTGNFEVTAQVKLETARLAPYLYRGAYASDSQRRSDLPAIAKKRWEQMARRGLRSEQCVVIGDTPRDLEAARENDMKCILIGTGRYPVEELLYYQPDGCLTDLTDTRSVLSVLSNL